MPIYTYKCGKCDHKFDVQASIKEKEKEKFSKKFNCPKCACGDTKQVFSLRTFFSDDKNDKGGGCCCSGGICG